MTNKRSRRASPVIAVAAPYKSLLQTFYASELYPHLQLALLFLLLHRTALHCNRYVPPLQKQSLCFCSVPITYLGYRFVTAWKP